MATIADLRSALARDPPVLARELCRRLGGIDRATLLRLVRRLDDEVLRLGKARRSAYALRRPVRGRQAPIPLYRIGLHGRAPVCTLASLNPALLGRAGEPWPTKATGLHDHGWLSLEQTERIRRLLWFGRLIANNDMHDGNLAFRPGLSLAPVYDMLPMQYAPTRSGEVPGISFQPPLPLPGDQTA